MILTKNGLWEIGYSISMNYHHFNSFTQIDNLPDSSSLKMASSGLEHILLLTKNGLYGYGKNSNGEIGLGNKIARTCVFIQIKGIEFSSSIISISCGYFHSMVLTKNGLWVCGNNKYGQLGLGRYSYGIYIYMLTNVQELNDYTIIKLACGITHTLVLTNDGLWGTGHNTYGALGLGDTDIRYKFSKIRFENSIINVSCGKDFSMLLTEQDLWITGSFMYNQWNTFTKIKLSPNISIVNIFCGNQSIFLITKDGILACGINSNGELGVGDYKPVLFPEFKPIKMYNK